MLLITNFNNIKRLELIIIICKKVMIPWLWLKIECYVMTCIGIKLKFYNNYKLKIL